MAVTRERTGGVVVVRIDDGKVNAISHDVIDAVNAALDAAERDGAAVLLAGRPGRFSGGFDLTEMRKGGVATASLVEAGARLALRVYGFPRPVVMACTGHAIAMGAILLLAGDFRLGAEGDFRIGMNEVAIGLTLPDFAVQLGVERLSKRHLSRATIQAEIYSPAKAVDAGYLDATAAPEALLDVALAEAKRLAALDAIAFAGTKRRLREPAIARIRDRLADDMAGLTAVPRT